MKICISNLAWISKENKDIYELLHKQNIKYLEIAPSIFTAEDDPYKINSTKITALKATLQQFDITISSMQSIHFGHKNIALFETLEQYDNLLDVSKSAIDFARHFNIGNIVFGSPKVRIIPDGLDKETIEQRWKNFFSSLADYAQINNTIIALEPNSTSYGTNFATNTADTIQIVRAINHAHFKVNLDMGTFILEKENLSLLNNNFDVINHIHISSPFLKSIYDNQEYKSRYEELIPMLKSHNYQNILSIEMLKQNENDNKKHVSMALKFLQRLIEDEHV